MAGVGDWCCPVLTPFLTPYSMGCSPSGWILLMGLGWGWYDLCWGDALVEVGGVWDGKKTVLAGWSHNIELSVICLESPLIVGWCIRVGDNGVGRWVRRHTGVHHLCNLHPTQGDVSEDALISFVYALVVKMLGLWQIYLLYSIREVGKPGLHDRSRTIASWPEIDKCSLTQAELEVSWGLGNSWRPCCQSPVGGGSPHPQFRAAPPTPELSECRGRKTIKKQ